MNLPNEVKIIILCLKRNILETKSEDILHLLNKPINWKLVLQKTVFLDVAGFIYNNLNIIQQKYKTVPINILYVLKSIYNEMRSKNIKLWKEFCNINFISRNNNIKIIPLKGLILSQMLYHDLGLRSIIDIDILININELISIEKILLKLGYKRKSKDLITDYWKKYHCHLLFVNPDKNIFLELHWAFAPPRPNKIDLTEVWQRAKLEKIEGQEVLTLSLEDTLLSLCINLCKNIPNLQFILLKNLCDINELITQYKDKLDWNYIINKTNQWRIKGCFYYLYILTKNFLETPWPEEIIKKIYPPVFKRKILSLYASNLKRRSQIQAILLMTLMLDSFIDVPRLIFKLIAQAFSIFIQNKRLFCFYLKR